MKILENTIKELLESKKLDSVSVAKTKRRMAKKFKTNCSSNMELLKAYHDLTKKGKIKPSYDLELALKTRPIRSLSGIVNVSVLTKEYPCPGKCIYCPTEKGIAKSYVSGEPAVERAKTLKHDPFLQVKKRIEMLEREGHYADKIEIRIVGGTWSCYPEKYQTQFIKKCFEACNQKNSKTLSEAQKQNERARYRIVGLSIETRPDYISLKEIVRLRSLGITLVELGVQSIDDDVLKKNRRDAKRKDIINATRLLKDAGFKVLYQIMPNLAGSTPKKDLNTFKEIFSNPDFQPDLLKIYPCALMKGTHLYKVWKQGKYRPYSEKKIIKLVKDIKKIVPYNVRIQRITRDIPSGSIVAGPGKINNLRQILKGHSEQEKWRCKCIRCREVGKLYDPKEKLYLFKKEYKASKGKEIFLTFENKERTKLYSLLRLRIPSKEETLPIVKDSTIIRELHTYGQVHPISKSKTKNTVQHKGLGKKLIKEAEKITKERNLNKITIISGIGVRGYYKKFGYRLKDTYMVKAF